MRYLLDTHIFLYSVIEPDRLSRDAITLGIPLIANDTRFPFYTKQGLQLIYNKN